MLAAGSAGALQRVRSGHSPLAGRPASLVPSTITDETDQIATIFGPLVFANDLALATSRRQPIPRLITAPIFIAEGADAFGGEQSASAASASCALLAIRSRHHGDAIAGLGMPTPGYLLCQKATAHHQVVAAFAPGHVDAFRAVHQTRTVNDAIRSRLPDHIERRPRMPQPGPQQRQPALLPASKPRLQLQPAGLPP